MSALNFVVKLVTGESIYYCLLVHLTLTKTPYIKLLFRPEMIYF